MDRICVNCKFTGIRLGVPQCNHTGHCLNYNCFEPRENPLVALLAENERLREALVAIGQLPQPPEADND